MVDGQSVSVYSLSRADRGRTGVSGLSLKPVYDIINCGPDHVFAVKTDHGLVLAHNCTQATGVDLLALGALNAERVGFEPFFLVHDQCLTPDDGRRNEFERAMCFVPDWFKGFPLSASADSVRSYCKT